MRLTVLPWRQCSQQNLIASRRWMWPEFTYL
jgi:hypothetical protein